MKFQIAPTTANWRGGTGQHDAVLTVQYLADTEFVPLPLLNKIVADAQTSFSCFNTDKVELAVTTVPQGKMHTFRVYTKVPADVILHPPFPWSVAP